MFVGRDARAGSNTSDDNVLTGDEAASGAGVSVDSSCQATRGDGKSIRFSRRILAREAKRPRTEARDAREEAGDVNNSMSSVSWQGSKDIDDSRSHHESEEGRDDQNNKEVGTSFTNFDNDDDGVSLDGSAETAITILHDETLPTPAEPLPFSNTEPTKQPSKPGDVFHRPMSQVVLSLPHLTPVERACAELYNLLDNAGAPLSLFDIVLRYIEDNLGKAFVPGCRLPRRDTFLNSLTQRFAVPTHENIPVTIEIGNEPSPTLGSTDDDISEIEQQIDRYRRGNFDTVTVPRWSFEDCLRSFVLDPFLFGNTENLVNKISPFEKYVSTDSNDTELLSGRFYSQSYDMKINDPTKEFLLVMDIYLDKTGKSAGITSSCGEPVIWSTPLLTNEVREHPYAWNLLGLIADLETGSSAKKRQDSGRKATKGRSLRNYHKILATILQGLIEYQKSGGKYMHVRMGDEVRFVKVIVVVGIISGDNKSGDAICGRFGGKNCHHRVSRLCMTGYKDLDDCLCSCSLVRMRDLESLQNGAADLDKSEKERNKYRHALKLMSSHYVDNAFFSVDFGSNHLGVTAATAPDMMHITESGIFKYLLNVFIDSMPNGTKAKVDALVEKLFVPIRSTKKSNFPRMNFKGGATSLTMLSSHHWPGMMLAFFIMLLTPQGREACKDCFQKDDMEIPDVDWEDAPKFDMNRVHVPEILKVNGPGGTDAPDIETQSEDEEEDDDDGIDEEYDDIDDLEDDAAEKKKKKKNKKAEALPCSHSQFVGLLQDLLVFHAWYKCGVPPKEDDMQEVLLCLRKLVHKIVTLCPRKDGNKWKLQKLHDLLHLVFGLYLFVHAKNFDAGRGERLLKDFFKRYASRSQERGRDVFISQVAKRAQEKMLLDKALLCSSMATNFTPEKRKAFIVPTLPSKPSFVLRYTSTTRACTSTWLGSNKSVEVHPMITTTFGWKWGDIIGRDITALPCYTEYCSPDGTRYRAHPNYNNEGPWYDWGLIRFEQPNRTECTDLFPCRILFFYVTPGEGVDIDNRKINVVVEASTYRNKLGDDKRRKELLYDTGICSRWQLSKSKASWIEGQGPKPYAPHIYSVPVKFLVDNVLVVEEDPGLKETHSGSRCIWVLTDRRESWPTLFGV